MRAQTIGHRSRHPWLAFLASMAMVMTLAAAPAAAAPERVMEPIFIIFPDLENDVIVFWNISRDDFCAWEASDFDGDPPVAGLVDATYNELPSGSVTNRWNGTAPIELWTTDEDADFSGPCQDTDNSTEPWATGTASARNNDNDLDHDASVEAGLSRTNAFGDRGQGTVVDGTGASWSYAWTFHATYDKNLEFVVHVDHPRLHRIG
jgi:hypothetical protein